MRPTDHSELDSAIRPINVMLPSTLDEWLCTGHTTNYTRQPNTRPSQGTAEALGCFWWKTRCSSQNLHAVALNVIQSYIKSRQDWLSGAWVGNRCIFHRKICRKCNDINITHSPATVFQYNIIKPAFPCKRSKYMLSNVMSLLYGERCFIFGRNCTSADMKW